jgi:hypothetical protein
MRVLWVLVATCTALGACGTTPIYRNPQVSEQQAEQDLADCQTAASSNRIEGRPTLTVALMLRTRDSCMRAKGYMRVN